MINKTWDKGKMMKQEQNSVIRLDKVEKDYQIGESLVRALAGVSLNVQRGEFIAIVGPSGSGKSTMMNMVGALDIPTEGGIYLDNQNIAHLHESDLAQIRGRKIGFVFQSFNLIPTLTAKHNVALPMLFQGVNETERVAKAEELLKRVGLGDRMDHYPNELSGGQRQRVAIARALANNPEVILADEPTGNLDTKTGGEIMNLFMQLHKEGTTIIVVTHDPNIANHAQKILKMKDGVFVEEQNGNQKKKR